METTVWIDGGFSSADGKKKLCEYTYGYVLFVKSFKDGVAIIEPDIGSEITSLICIVVGCFDKSSNFLMRVKEMFGSKEETLKEIRFEFNGVNVSITHDDTDIEQIYNQWRRAKDALIKISKK